MVTRDQEGELLLRPLPPALCSSCSAALSGLDRCPQEAAFVLRSDKIC